MTIGDFITPDAPPPPRDRFVWGYRGECLRWPEFISHSIRMRGLFEWTPACVDEAVNLWVGGCSVPQIAAYFQVKLGAVEGMIQRHRTKFPRRPENANWKWGRSAEINSASSLWRSGKSVSEIARTLGFKKNQISGMINRNRDLFPPRPSPIKRG